MAGGRTHCSKSRLAGALAALALLVPAWLVQAQEAWREADVSRVVVFGDVHGAYSRLVDVLQATGVIGPDLAWTAGTTHVVSLGDLLDRGDDARKVLELIMRLQQEAAEHGGRLHVILGNHELMNLIGDLRYVSPGDYAAFAAEEDEAAREAAYAAFAATAPPDSDAAATRELFERAHPRGYFARRAAFAPSGRYGAWLLSLPTIVVVNDTAYVHGGLPTIVAEAALELNDELRADLRRYLELRDRLAAEAVLPSADMQRDIETARAALAAADPELAPLLEEFIALGEATELTVDGPLWYRGSVYCKPLLEAPKVDAALERLGVRRAVVGHTPTGDRRVRSLYDGKLVMLDTGMLEEYFHGRAAALVLEDGQEYIQYAGPTERGAIDPSGDAQDYARTEAELRQALEEGTVTAVERGANEQPWRITLRHEDSAIEASFYPRAGGGNLELAAAALDDLLGTALVAPTVARRIEGEDGALQLRYQDAVTEAERVERQLVSPGWCPLAPQARLMYVFDALTFNRGRTVGNVVYRNDLTDLTLTDHRLAFGTERALPASLDPSALDIPPALVAALRALDERRLKASLGAWLDSRRLRALLARRDRLVQD